MGRWIIRAGLVVVAIIAALALSVLGFVALPGPVAWVANRLSGVLSGPGQVVEIGRIGIKLPETLTIDAVTLSDAAGPWLRVKDVRLTFALSRLFVGRAEIRALTVGDVALDRLPASGGASHDSGGPVKLPIALAFDAVEVAALRLGATVLGDSVVLAATGKARAGSDRISASATLRRLDGQEGRFQIDADYEVAPASLKLVAELDEPSGLLAGRVLGQPSPVRVRVDGNGALADWRGTFEAYAGAAHLTASARLVAQGQGYAAEVDGTVAAQDLLPAPYSAIVGNDVRFALEGNNAEPATVTLDRATIELAAGTVRGQGAFATADRGLSGGIDANVPSLVPFEGLVAAPVTGSANLHLDLTGTPERPAVVAMLDLADGVVAGTRVAHLDAALRAAMLDDWSVAQPRVGVAGSGALEGVSMAGKPLPVGLDRRLEWSLAATGDLAGERIDVSKLSLADAGMTLDASLGLSKGAVAGEAVVALPHMAALAAPIAGQARLAADFSIAPTGAVTARFGGTVDDLTGVPPAIAELLGRHVEISGLVRRATDGSLAVDDVALSASKARIAADGTAPPELDRFAAALRLDIPELADAGIARLRGQLRAKAALAGPWAAPRLDATLDAVRLAYGTAQLDRATAEIAVADLGAPSGTLSGTLASGALAGTWRTAFTLGASGDRLALTKLRLDAAGASIGGSLTIALSSGLTAGTLSGTIPDLAPFSTLAGERLAGRVEARATLSVATGQAVDFTVSARSLALGQTGVGQVAAARLSASGRLTDLLGHPAGRADFSLAGGAVGDGKLDHATLKLASLAPGRFHFDAETSGKVLEPATLTAAGEVGLEPQATTVRLDRLDGSLAGDKLTLTRPLLWQQSVAGLSFADLALTIGTGHLSGSGALRGDALELTLKGDRLPLALGARLAGSRDISGRLGIDAALSGTIAAPQGRLILTGDALRFAAATHPDLPALSASVEAEWQESGIAFRGRVDGPHQAAIGFAGSAPLAVRRPFAVVLAPDGPLALKLEGGGELSDIADLMPLGDDLLTGHYALAADVSGTIALPVAGGHVTLAHGRYESMAAGTILSDVELELDGNAQRFVLQRFGAGDGGTGRVAGQGGVVLAGPEGPVLDLKLALQRFRAVRLDDVDATVDGSITLSGTLLAPRIGSDLTVAKAEIRIPDRLPASVPDLQVIRVNRGAGQVPAAPMRAPEAPIALALHVAAPGQVFVRGRGLDSEWRGALDVRGTAAVPVVAGTLEVAHGTFNLLGKDFSLTRGTMAFTGSQPPDPLLDILAEAATSDITAQVVIGGTASAPTVKLTSQPEMPQDEILSRVLFGGGLSQLTPLQGLQLAQAAAQLAGGGGPDLLGTVRRELGLDRLSIGSTTGSGAIGGSPGLITNQQQSAAGGTALSAGKYIAPGFYVGVQQGVGSGGGSAVRVEGEITKNLGVAAQAGGAGAQGGESVGINLKFDY
jgi:translocation and assembly module TamB